MSVVVYGQIQLFITMLSLVLVATLKTVKNPRLVTNCASLLPLSPSPIPGFGEVVGFRYLVKIIYVIESLNEMKEG